MHASARSPLKCCVASETCAAEISAPLTNFLCSEKCAREHVCTTKACFAKFSVRRAGFRPFWPKYQPPPGGEKSAAEAGGLEFCGGATEDHSVALAFRWVFFHFRDITFVAAAAAVASENANDLLDDHHRNCDACRLLIPKDVRASVRGKARILFGRSSIRGAALVRRHSPLRHSPRSPPFYSPELCARKRTCTTEKVFARFSARHAALKPCWLTSSRRLVDGGSFRDIHRHVVSKCCRAAVQFVETPLEAVPSPSTSGRL